MWEAGSRSLFVDVIDDKSGTTFEPIVLMVQPAVDCSDICSAIFCRWLIKYDPIVVGSLHVRAAEKWGKTTVKLEDKPPVCKFICPDKVYEESQLLFWSYMYN